MHLSAFRSEVYAADLYEASFAKDPLSPEAGRRWRYEVLERASCQPELEVLERYLGRPLSVDAIFEQIAHAK
jgi:Zn-dependent oligopeptidase